MMGPAPLVAAVGVSLHSKANGRSHPFPNGCQLSISSAWGCTRRRRGPFSVAFREFPRSREHDPGARLCLLEIPGAETGVGGRIDRSAYMNGRLVPLLARHPRANSPQSAPACSEKRYYWDTIETCGAPREAGAVPPPRHGPAGRFADVRRHVETRKGRLP